MRCPYCDFYSATMRCPHCQSAFDAASAEELAHLSYLRNRLHRWGAQSLLPPDTVAWAIAVTQPEVSRLQEKLGLAPKAPAPAPAGSAAPLASVRSAASPPALLPPAAPRPARTPFSWARVGRYLLSERTLNTLLALGALLILASAFVISTLNPTRLAPARTSR